MSKFQELKRELSILEKTFGPRHEHFRVEANGLDEVTCRFLATNGEHVVHCNIFVSNVLLYVVIKKTVYDINYENDFKVVLILMCRWSNRNLILTHLRCGSPKAKMRKSLKYSSS